MTKANSTDSLRAQINAKASAETDTAVLRLVLRILEISAEEEPDVGVNTSPSALPPFRKS